MTTPDTIFALGATLGEGPVWIEDRLWLVDILQHRIHCLQPDAALFGT